MQHKTKVPQIFQIFFREEQRAHLDPSFIPYDNSKNRFPEQMEYRVFLENYELGRPMDPKFSHTGLVSWKFGQKTKISGRKFLRFIESNPGADVYFINPFPSELRWKNVWLQGDMFHPGLVDFSQKIFNKAGHSINLKEIVNGESTAAYCNYWVGNAVFWEKYISFTKPIYDYLINDATEEEKSFLWKPADRKIKATYFPFIFERMFSTLLATDSSIQSEAYRYSGEAHNSRWLASLARSISKLKKNIGINK